MAWAKGMMPFGFPNCIGMPSCHMTVWLRLPDNNLHKIFDWNFFPHKENQNTRLCVSNLILYSLLLTYFFDIYDVSSFSPTTTPKYIYFDKKAISHVVHNFKYAYKAHSHTET